MYFMVLASSSCRAVYLDCESRLIYCPDSFGPLLDMSSAVELVGKHNLCLVTINFLLDSGTLISISSALSSILNTSLTLTSTAGM
jgi:hypothetical protein